MKRIAEFKIVSKNEYLKVGTEEEYGSIKLPKRATSGSAGYDFFLPKSLKIGVGETVTVATGIRCKIDEGWFLSIYPRSGLGFKYRLTLNNTVGIIDSDYYNADNEGHIFIRMTNCGNLPIELERGKAFAQGVFTEYGITFDDDTDAERIGGIGSTDKK